MSADEQIFALLFFFDERREGERKFLLPELSDEGGKRLADGALVSGDFLTSSRCPDFP